MFARAVALGHPLGASGARIIRSLISVGKTAACLLLLIINLIKATISIKFLDKLYLKHCAVAVVDVR